MLRPAVDALARISYEGGESDEAGRAWVAGLTSHLDAHVASLQPLLTRRNYEGLVSLILADIANSTPPLSMQLCHGLTVSGIAKARRDCPFCTRSRSSPLLPVSPSLSIFAVQ